MTLQAVGPFQVERLLARGGMGEAYLGRDQRTGRLVLLKLPAPELLGDIAAHARFEREGEALRRLHHPGVQRWIENGRSGLRPYVALEYAEGQPLREVLRQRGRLPAAEAVRIARDLADALAYCHEHGVVHRDVKPENVILAQGGRPVLIDFGSVLLEGARRLTYSGFSGELGTPEYMAPEQVQGKRGDARTDVYALGTLLYELLAGRPPFAAAPGDSAVQVMRRHLEEHPAAPAAGGPLDGALLGVLAMALRKNPAERFPSMAAFRDALANPGAAVASGAVTAGWPASPAARAGSWNAPLDEPRSLRDWLRYIGMALLTLLALVAIGVLAALLKPSGS